MIQFKTCTDTKDSCNEVGQPYMYFYWGLLVTAADQTMTSRPSGMKDKVAQRHITPHTINTSILFTAILSADNSHTWCL